MPSEARKKIEAQRKAAAAAKRGRGGRKAAAERNETKEMTVNGAHENGVENGASSDCNSKR